MSRLLRTLICQPVLVALMAAVFFPGGFWLAHTTSVSSHSRTTTDSLEVTLKALPIDQLVERVMTEGDPARGALLFHNPELTCVRCHQPDPENHVRLGPAIAELNNQATVQFLIESLLDPSREITEGFQTETILTVAGKQITGLIIEENADGFLVLADPDRDGLQTRIAKSDIDERKKNKVSAMPAGLVGALSDERSFLDLVRYLLEIKRGGTKMELQLRPPDAFFAIEPLPEYEANIDHASLIGSLNRNSFQRGEAIYTRFCARCHGTDSQEGTMPSALKFTAGKFKNGNDPHAMYQTLTHGYGLMVAQRWMVPKQKYDVIHYIREHFLKRRNPDQLATINETYLAALPRGSESGPDPVDKTPWSDMDYGNFLFNTYEVGDDGSNIAYKGIAVRLDQGPGGVSQGKHWMLYDHDTMRIAAAWSGQGFIDYNGIHFNDRHNIHPRIAGDIHLTNQHQPGWANPQTDSFDPDPRVRGRDDKPYGPLPEGWLKYRGLYQFDDRVVLNYTVGQTAVLESPGLQFTAGAPVFRRTMNLSSREKPLWVKVTSVEGLHQIETGTDTSSVFFAMPEMANANSMHSFDGSSYLTTDATFDWDEELTIAARIKTGVGGTIICQTADKPDWVPGGTSLFVRDGRLVFDIGWVGAVTSRRRVSDNQWHDVALVWKPGDKSVQLFIDGELDRQGELEPGEDYDNPVVRIGYTAGDFPDPSVFDGHLSHLKVWDKALAENEIANIEFGEADEAAVADWSLLQPTSDNSVHDRSPRHNHATWQSMGQLRKMEKKNTWAVANGLANPRWSKIGGSLCLRIPAGAEPLALEIYVGADVDRARADLASRTVSAQIAEATVTDLPSMIRGGPARYPDLLTSKIETMPVGESDAFAVDYLNHPEKNPWSCRLRLTGIDFVSADRAVICAWDGSVWQIGGFLNSDTLTWRRIAHGLFQPLGIRVLNGEIFVTCRDQLVHLQDLNDDGVVDFYQAFNSDHQVTEHFHEFAMGLQTDRDGNFYYAKSARHALPALVPHHGTLLKISADGSRTEILANGFRAANGVCLNPDGTFFVTDQEGHWTPKNRINWVRGAGGFYGNMLGYHDVEDESDDAMQQPLCWITNSFDRSPGELLWVPENAWGPIGGSLLNLSYGMGQVFVVPYETVSRGGQKLRQGGMCALPIPMFPTGVMRGRFHVDGHLYCCGMYAWAGNRQKPGGLYRIRHTGNPAWLPKSLSTTKNKILLEWSDPLDDSATDINRYVIRTWDIRRTSNYGSEHLNEQELTIESIHLDSSRNAIEFSVTDLQPTRCMEIKCRIRTPEGREVNRAIHNTIHQVESSDGTK